MWKQAITILGLTIFVNGCSTSATRSYYNVEMLLLPPNWGPADTVLKQIVTIRSEERDSSFYVVTKLDKFVTKSLVLTPSGRSLLSLEYDGKNLSLEIITNIALPYEEILATMQFTLWPQESLLNYYSPNNGWDIYFLENQRILLFNKKKLLSVTYEPDGNFDIENYRHSYNLKIKNLDNAK